MEELDFRFLLIPIPAEEAFLHTPVYAWMVDAFLKPHTDWHDLDLFGKNKIQLQVV